MPKKIQRAGLDEARCRCREAMSALIDVEIALAGPGAFGSTLLLSHARIKLGVARDSVFGLKDDLDHLFDFQLGLTA